jgi:phage/plasmid primase-like uncharacterized protein/KaiC/GvpD/RAD55 family RecA-like ATPase
MADKSKYPTIYWDEYADRIINKYNLKETKKGEFHGPCVACGGTDRFWIFRKQNGELGVHCRQCEDFTGIMDEMRHDGVLPTAQEIEYKAPIAVNDLSDFTAIIPYHEKKGIELFNAKQIGDNIVVPIVDISGKRVNKQTITPDGKKKFDPKPAPVEGCFNVLNGPLEGVCYLAEGFATAASIAQSTQRPAVFCLNSGNLPKVAELLLRERPECKFIVAADNDDAGIKAAKETGLPYRAPREAKWDWNDVMVNHGPLAVAKELKRVRMPKPLFVPLGDLEFKAPEWLIDGLLEANTFSVCFGSPAAGKTFLTLDMALCIATGKDFHDHHVKQGAVFYIAGEGHNGFARRAAAWSKENGISLKGVPFFKSSRAIVITDDNSVAELVDTIDAMVQQYGEPQLIVIDTLARSMGAADENSTKEMGAAIRAIDECRDAYDCTVLAVHHTGHSNKERARGSSALLGAVDAEFMVDKWFQDDSIAKVEVKFTKMKDAKIPEPMNFIHKEIELTGADLEPTTSVVLEPILDTNPRHKVSKLTGNKKRFMDALEKALEGGGRGANVQDVRDIFYKSLVGVKDDSKRKTWTRAFQDVSDLGLISSTESMIYNERDNGT